MSFRRLHLSFTEYRRRRLAKKVDRLDRLESRTTITEPISFTGMAPCAMAGLARLGFLYPEGASNALRSLSRAKDAAKQAGHSSPKPYTTPANLLKSIDAIAMNQVAGGGSAAAASSAASSAKPAASDSSNDWLTFKRRRLRTQLTPTASQRPRIRPRDPAAGPPRHRVAARAPREESRPQRRARSRHCDCP